jgi:hypothetical protein
MLQDSRLDDLGQVCTLSRQGILASPQPLSVSLQDGLRFLPVPIPPEEFGFTRLRLIRLLSTNGQTPWGLPCSVDNPSLKCLGAPSPAVAHGTANQQNGSADSGYLPFWLKRVMVFRLS